MDPIVARRTWRTLEPIHGMIYFAPEAAEEYAALGVTGRSGYFASRSAPMGQVNAEVVLATFFNFHPDLVRGAMDGVWTTTTPASISVARMRAADRSLHRVFGSDVLASEDVAEAAALARVAAETACGMPEGRPLFAGHASLDWPDEPPLVLWHAQTLLREFRGDGHIALLTAAGLTGLEALILHAATGQLPRAALQQTRAWGADEWQAGIEALALRGLVDADGAFTDAGRDLRAQIEADTDALAAAPYAALGESECDQLRVLARPLSRAIVDAGMLGVMSDTG